MQVRNNGVLVSGCTHLARPVSAGRARRCYALLADEDLISLVAAGDALAFAALYGRHSPAAHSLARRLTRNEQDAEDLAQDAFLKVWSPAESYRAEKGGVRKWIFCVVRNRNIDLLRSRATRRRTLAKAEAEPPSPQPSEPFAPCWRDMRRDLVCEALGELPHAQRTVLALNHFSELTHAEIAGLLCVPLGTVKGRVRLGLEKLRNHPELREMAVG